LSPNFLDAKCTPCTVDPDGKVSSGYIIIETAFIPAQLDIIEASVTRKDLFLKNQASTPLILTRGDFDYQEEASKLWHDDSLYCAIVRIYDTRGQGNVFLLLLQAAGPDGWKHVCLASRTVHGNHVTEVSISLWMELAQKTLTELFNLDHSNTSPPRQTQVHNLHSLLSTNYIHLMQSGVKFCPVMRRPFASSNPLLGFEAWKECSELKSR
jgi:hypothetical protein